MYAFFSGCTSCVLVDNLLAVVEQALHSVHNYLLSEGILKFLSRYAAALGCCTRDEGNIQIIPVHLQFIEESDFPHGSAEFAANQPCLPQI